MKKIIASLCFIIAFSIILNGQNADFSKEEQPPKVIHQIGMNVGPLVKSLLNKGDLNNNLTQGTLTYKRIKNNRAFRSGLLASFQKEVFGDNPNNKRSRYSITGWVGIEKQKVVSKQWQYYVGADVRFASSSSKFNFFNEPSKFRSLTFAPLLGIQFRITPQLILQTEASLNFYYRTADNVFNIQPFPIDPFFAYKNKTKGVNITLPNVLYLAFEF